MVEPRREELLIYDHESKNQRGIFHKLDDQYDVSVTFEDDLTNLGSVSSTKDVVAICGVQNKDHISDIDSCLNNDTPIIGVTKQEEIADHMLSEGFDEYLLYGDTETDLAVKGLHRRFQLLKNEYTPEGVSVHRSEMVKFAPNVFVVFDKDMSIKYFNEFSHAFNDLKTDVENKEDLMNIIHPDDQEKVLSDFKYMLDNSREIVNTQFRAKSEDDEWLWFESSGQNLIGYKGIDGVLCTVSEISEMKDKEQELRESRDRLDDVISIMSHDLRNLINVAMARSKMLEEAYDDENAKSVRRSMERMTELISDSLDIAESGKKVRDFDNIELDRLVRNCADNVASCDDADIKCVDKTVVRADKSRLSNLLENLFNNSVEHNDCSVGVRVGKIENRDGFFVEDNGTGIDDDVKDKVFTSGYSGDPSGTGLGLNIVEQISNAHDWELELKESETGGARFEFTGVKIIEVV